jgi:hypothetical protein
MVPAIWPHMKEHNEGLSEPIQTAGAKVVCGLCSGESLTVRGKLREHGRDGREVGGGARDCF